jgi:NTE family protein
MQLRKLYLRIASFLFLYIFISIFGISFTSAENMLIQSQRPKIGLTLGGGSAGGFAHIGVLKWLEEHRIPVDYITGTSMGGLMGGCYAMGMAPEDIRALAKNIDWIGMFNPRPPYDSLDFRRKEDRWDYPLAGVGLRGGKISLPSGLSIYQVDMVLSRVTLQYSMVNNFDELPIPFKCVATDIRSYQPVVLENGSLKRALRATMSIPGVFTPVEYNGRLLVDGGVLNNVPVETVKKMGADVVIAVNIPPTPLKNNQPESIGSVISQTLDTVVANNANASLAMANVVLEPPLGELDHYQWNAVDRYAELGYQATDSQKKALLKYSLDEASWNQYLQERQKRCRLSMPIPQALEISGTTGINKAIIQKRLKTYIGRPVNKEFLEQDLTGLMGSGLYESLSYEYALRDGQVVLLITAQEKSYGPPFINLGIHSVFAVDSDDDYKINVVARITSFNIAGPRSELRTDIGVGSELKLQSELYKPFSGNSNWFIAPAAYVKQVNNCLIESGKRITNYNVNNYGLGCDLGYTFNEFSEGRLGLMDGYQSTHVTLGEPLVTDFEGEIQRARFQWTFSSLDNAVLSLRGLNIDFDADWYFKAPDSSNEFGLVENKIFWIYPVGRQKSIFTYLSGGFSYNGDLPLPQQFKLGGPFRLGAYSFDEFHGDNYLLGGIGFLKGVGKMPSGKNIYLGVWMENGGVFEKRSDLNLKSDLSVGLITTTIIGPVFASVSVGENSNTAYYIGVGYLF